MDYSIMFSTFPDDVLPIKYSRLLVHYPFQQPPHKISSVRMNLNRLGNRSRYISQEAAFLILVDQFSSERIRRP